jgi:pimeloyl-ACP methyl ester carboxylesterase
VSPHALQCTFDEAIDRPLWHDLDELDVPTLVVRGDGSGPMTEDDWSRYETEVPRCERVVFEDSPHDLFRNDRHRYAHLVRRHVTATDELVNRSSGKQPTS